MKNLLLTFILIFIMTSSGFAQINTLTGWDGMNLSVLNDDLRKMSETSGLQKINTINDFSSGTSISVLNDDLVLIGRQLSIPQMSAVTGFDDTNLTVLNDDLQFISQALGG